VLGQKDLAEQVHRALGESGVAAEIFRGLPSSARDGLSATTPGVDVVVVSEASGLDYCAVVKKAVRSRPVAAVVMPGAERRTAHWAKTRGGPDASVVWPCTGEAIVEACRRASESAKVRRPWIPLSWAPLFILTAAAIGVILADLLGQRILPSGSFLFLCGLQFLYIDRYSAVRLRFLRILGLIEAILGLVVVAERLIFHGWSGLLH